ncbi:MAG: MMPL family transporter [Pseudomonadota bacterium]
MRNDYLPNQVSVLNLYQRVLQWVTRHPWAVIFCFGMVSLFFAWNIPNMTTGTSIYDLVIEDLPVTKQYQDFQKLFGSDDIIRIVVKGENIFHPVFFSKLEHLAEQSTGIKGVRRVISLPEIKKTVDPSGTWSLETFSAKISPVPLFRKNLISDDRKTTALTLLLESDADPNAVIDAVNRIIATESDTLTIYQIGIPLVSEAIARFTEKDLFTILPLTFLMVAVILYILFGNIRILVLPLLCIAVSIIWMFGFMAILKIPLAMLTMIVPVFMTAVGTAYCLHLLTAFLENADVSPSVHDAVCLTWKEMTLPTMLAVFTTATGLGSLFINRISAIQEFALFSCFGLFSLLLVLLFFLPALLVLLPLPLIRKKPKRTTLSSRFTRITRTIATIDLKYRKPVFIVSGIVCLLSVAGVLQLQVETNPVGYFRENTDISRNFHDIYQDLSGSFPINVVLKGNEDDYFEDPAHLTEISDLQQFLESLPKVDKTVSFTDYLKLVNYSMNRYEKEFYVLPKESYELRMLLNSYKMLLGRDMLTQFMDESYSKANIMLLTHISSSRDFLATRSRIQEYAKQRLSENIAIDVTGIGMVISESSHHLVQGQIKSLFLTMGIVFSAMFILFLSGKVGLVAILVNFFPVLVTFGIMGWFGIELSMATGLIASIAIGLAVDDTIHYLVRYNREFKKDLDKDRALRDTIEGVGKPIIFTSLTISIGFSLLLFSHFGPTAVFGVLMMITMLSALVGDMILLPSLMLHVELVTAWDLLRLMPSLGGISAGIAHELNQPLNAIKMGSEYLKTMLQKGKTIQDEDLSLVVNEINGQVNRASDIIRRLSLFGRKPDFLKQKVNINQPIRDTLSVLENQLRVENIHVELSLSQDIRPILGHAYQLGQMFYNLLVNAMEAINRVTGQDGNPCLIVIRTFMENGYTTVTISDTGCGIPNHLRERVFEPFFTTKESGKGKGLGLSITHEIIHGINGRIAIQSKKGTGTTFTICFPPAEMETEEAGTP